MLRPEHRDRTFVILATSHYGQPEKFGLTRKTFVTPLGDTTTDQRLVDWLAERGGAPSRWRTTATRSSTPSSCR